MKKAFLKMKVCKNEESVKINECPFVHQCKNNEKCVKLAIL